MKDTEGGQKIEKVLGWFQKKLETTAYYFQDKFIHFTNCSIGRGSFRKPVTGDSISETTANKGGERVNYQEFVLAALKRLDEKADRIIQLLEECLKEGQQIRVEGYKGGSTAADRRELADAVRAAMAEAMIKHSSPGDSQKQQPDSITHTRNQLEGLHQPLSDQQSDKH